MKKIITLLTLILTSFLVSADCGCEGEMLMHLTYIDDSNKEKEAWITGTWYDGDKTNAEEKFLSRIKSGEKYYIVKHDKTDVIKLPSGKNIQFKILGRTNKRLSKETFKNITTIKKLNIGCNSTATQYNEVSYKLYTTGKLIKVVEENDEFGIINVKLTYKLGNYEFTFQEYISPPGVNCA